MIMPASRASKIGLVLVLVCVGSRKVLGMTPCDSDPCLNGGTCTDSMVDFTCACPKDYTGDQCETENSAALTNCCVFTVTFCVVVAFMENIY